MALLTSFGVVLAVCLATALGRKVVVEKMPASGALGTWTYEDPGKDEVFGQYMYVSPMGRTCIRNLTVKATQCSSCYIGFVTPAYVLSRECIPACLEGIARLTDHLNGRPGVLQDACIQLVVSDYNDLGSTLPPLLQSAHHFANDVVEAVHKGPRKHGIITDVPARNGAKIFEAAANLAVPLIRTGPASGGGFSEDPVDPQRWTEFRTLTDSRWVLPGIVKRLLPSKFAVLTDTTTASGFLRALKAESAKQSKKIAVSQVVLTETLQDSDEEAINEMVDEMVKLQISYLLVKMSWPPQARFLACTLYKKNLHRRIQVLCLGHAMNAVFGGYLSCGADEELAAVLMDGGWMFVSDGFYSGFSSEEDYIVNRATGNPGKLPTGQSLNVAGGPWQDHFDFGELQPTLACADDDAGTNASSTFRTLLSEGLGESLSCQDVTFLGQSWSSVVVRDVAKYCPISACAYNSLMAACRVSCACSLVDPAGTLEHPEGGALCREIQNMPSDVDPRSGYRAEHWRCEGRSCRELAFAPSAIAFREPILKLAHSLNGAGTGFCPYKYSWTPDDNSSSACLYGDINMWMWWNSGNLVDGLYSFAMAFQCMEKKDQLVDFIESDYNNAEMRDSLVDCLRNNVSFEGMGGRISFGYLQSPPPGHTYSALDHSSSLAGAVLQDDVVLFNKVISRENWLACEDGTSEYAPQLYCNGTSIEFNLDQDNWDVFPLGSPVHCPVGEYPITIGEHVEGVRLDECTPCPPGTYKDISGPSRCQACPPGWASASSGQSACVLCGLGNRSAAPANATVLNLGYVTQQFGASRCDYCADGYDSEMGASDCVACSQGRYREVGVSPRQLGVHCTACPIGRYLEHTGGSQCEACPAGLSTQSTSSTSLAECICGAGTYKKDGSCHPCPEAMTCIAGSDEKNFPGPDGNHNGPFPQLKYSFYTTAEEPLAPFLCMRESACPGGPPGSCSGSLTGLTCTTCPQGKFFQSGECSDCDVPAGLITLVLLLAAAFVTALHILTNWSSASASMPIVICGVIAGMAVNFFLTLVSFRSLSMVWVAPLSGLFGALSLFSFNFESFSLFCSVTNDSYILGYVLKLLVVPVSFAMLFAGAFVCSHVPRLRHVASFNVPALLNSTGFVMSAFFISVGLASLEGFRCIKNPNNKWTLLADTSVICFKGGEHMQIMVLSVCAVLSCPLLFIALNLWVTIRYAQLSLKYGVKFTAAVRFLTLRVRPEYLGFAFAWNCRGFLVSLLPVLANGEYEIQVGLLMATFICWVVTQTYTNCWRFWWVNIMDPVLGACTILILFGFAMLGSNQQKISDNFSGWYIIAVAATTMLVLMCTAGYHWGMHVTNKTRYGVFVSHHKAAAALYARQLKIMFDLPNFAPPFLDVDDLDDLDKLVFAVKASSRLLVILTKSVLERPWCALEVATAYLNHIPTAVVQPNDDAVELSPQYLAQVVSSFSSEDWSIFSRYGVTRDALVAAFDHFAELPKIVYLLRTSNLPLLDQCVRLSLGAEANRFKKHIFSVDPSKVVHIVYNTKDDLQCSAAFVALQLFRERQWDAMLCGPGDEVFPERLEAKRGVGVVFLSKGLPADPTAMGILLAMQRAGIGFVPVLSQENFWKPDAAVLESLRGGRRSRAGPEAEQMQEMERLAPGASLEEMAQTLPLLYSKIALGFAPECNYRLMLAEFKIIEERANGQLRANAAGVASVSTGASPTTSRASSPRGKGRRDAAAAASPPHDDVPLSDPIETGGGGGGGSASSEDHQQHQQQQQLQQQQQQQQPPSDPLETGGVGGSASSEDQQPQLQQQQLQQLQQRPSTLEMENDEPCVARGGAGSRQ